MDSLEAFKSSALTNELASHHFHCALILSHKTFKSDLVSNIDESYSHQA